MSKWKKQVPNILTVLRIVLAFFCIYFAYHSNIRSLSISLVLFCIASLTDYFDGYLARRWNIVSSFGKLMDPIADKILILGVLFVFAVQDIVPMVLAVIIAAREAILTILRLMISKKAVLASRYSGKVKTASQIVVLILIYVSIIYKEELLTIMHIDFIYYTILVMVLWLTVISIYSAFDFLRHNRKVMEKELDIRL